MTSVLVACGSEAPAESCVTNRDCPGGRCVNGRCAPEVDGGDDVGDACVPWTCESLGQVCRSADDGCGGRLECGTPGVTTHRAIEWGASPYANWNFGGRLQESLTHSVCFDEVPSPANGFGRGMYIQLYGGNVDEQNFDYGFRDRTADLGGAAGFIFSKYVDNDPAHIRLGPNSVSSDLSVPGVSIGVRMPLDWTVGCYTTRLERGEAQAGGDWMNMTVTRDGVDQYVGSLWFARASSDSPVTISSGSGTWTEFFDFAGASSDEIPRYDFRVRAEGDGIESEFTVAQYNALAWPNSSCEFLASTREVRFIVGGDTFRCVPGARMGDFFEQRWMSR